MTHLEIIQRVWPEWIITEKIGEGSFGQVFKAEKESFGIKQESAIKLVRIPSDESELNKVRLSFGLDDEELRDYFYPQLDKLKKEIELMMKLDDNNIVKIHDFEIKESFDSRVGWYMLIRMELLECLEKYVKKTDITVGDVVAIGEDILSCLETCEENNIIHRDIKPANLFRNDKGVYKLGDFGIARDMSVSEGSLSYKGTENYMAPEVYMGKHYNATIDIYALGIILYKLLNKNRLPFISQEKLTSASIEKAFQKRNTGEPLPEPVQSSASIYEVIKKMCAYKPEDRFQTAAEARKALVKYKNEAGEELKTILDINNRLRKSADTKSREEVIKEDTTTQAQPEAEFMEQGIPTETRAKAENTDLELPDADMENIEASIPGRILNEPYNEEQGDEESNNKTRSLYQEKYKLIQKESKSPNIRQSVIEGNNGAKNKKKKTTLRLGVGGAAVAIAAIFMLVLGGENASKVAKAKKIYSDDHMFVIDKEKYRGQYIEHTTKFLIDDELVERKGIYVGATKSGEPNGYGAFYYRREGTDEDGKYTKDCIYIGTWEKGSLAASGRKNGVKERVFLDEKYNDTGDKLIYEYITTGDWGTGGFAGNPKGIYESTYTNNETGKSEEMNFKGIFEAAGYGYNLLNGDLYFNGNLYYRGEFKDDKPYNGTYYDENGKEADKVVNGERGTT